MRLKIGTKVFLAFLGVIVVTAGAAVFNFFLLNALSQRYNHIISVVDPTEKAIFDLQNSFNKDIRAVEEYGNGFGELAETEEIIRGAETNIADNIKIIENSDLAKPELIVALKDILEKDGIQDEKVFELRQAGKDARPALIAFDETNSEVVLIIDQIVEAARQHKLEDAQEFRKAIYQSKVYIILTLAGGIGVSFLVAFGVTVPLTSSIKKVRDAAVKMSQGDLMQKLTIVSQDEIGDLATAFNEMAASARAKTSEMEASKKQLELVNAEIGEKLTELQKINSLMIDRELKMIELKKEIANLKLKP